MRMATETSVGWRSRAACTGHQHTLFFPSGDAETRNVERARAICMACPVTEPCLEFALETNQRAGIWGGTSEEERKALRRKWLATRRRVG
jgi:WhiB family redox-sensing transcriptional regulator